MLKGLKMIKYGEAIKLSDNRSLERTYAIVITDDGNIYESDINHQECFLNYKKDFFEKYGIDMFEEAENYDTELEKAIGITDSLFQKNEFYGFDIYSDLSSGYFVSHYPQNLEKCYCIAKDYADSHDLDLASFISSTELSDCFRIVLGIV